ncbi:hypothetical protein [Methylocella sp.]|uniref:hypothetical protein n=1 Tax=Methylocella sp. TaxID=1978226 RepID=UPI003783780E
MNDAPTPTISKADLARHLGVAKSRISALLKRGLPTQPDGKIILADALAWIRANCEQKAAFPDRGVNKVVETAALEESEDDEAEPVEAEALDDEDGVLDYAEARALKETFLARKARLDYRRARDELVEIEAVADVVAEDFAIVRERLLSIPGKLASKLVGKGRAAIEAAIRDEVHEILEELSAPEDVGGDAIRKGEAK